MPGLLAAFELMDVDSDGCLTEEELTQLPIDVIPINELKKLSVNDMSELFQLLDVDGRDLSEECAMFGDLQMCACLSLSCAISFLSQCL